MFKTILEWLIKENLEIQHTIKVGDIFYPSEDMAKTIHNLLIKFFKGKDNEIHEGQVNEGSLYFSLYSVKHQVGNNKKSKKEKVIIKAAHMMNNFFTSHIFTDGNKRTGFVLFLLFFTMNRFIFNINIYDYMKNTEFFRKIAHRDINDKRNVPEILEWFKEYEEKLISV